MIRLVITEQGGTRYCPDQGFVVLAHRELCGINAPMHVKLAHELGHVALQHTHPERRVCEETALMELEAWVWALRRCWDIVPHRASIIAMLAIDTATYQPVLYEAFVRLLHKLGA